jgi:hypothetical protein
MQTIDEVAPFVTYNHLIAGLSGLIQKFINPDDADKDRALFAYRTCTDMVALLDLALAQDIQSVSCQLQDPLLRDGDPAVHHLTAAWELACTTRATLARAMDVFDQAMTARGFFAGPVGNA